VGGRGDPFPADALLLVLLRGLALVRTCIMDPYQLLQVVRRYYAMLSKALP
jgi:hypothetical protein